MTFHLNFAARWVHLGQGWPKKKINFQSYVDTGIMYLYWAFTTELYIMNFANELFF
jgi:hypothetical protein